MDGSRNIWRNSLRNMNFNVLINVNGEWSMVNSEQELQECDPSTSFPINIGTTLMLNLELDVERSVATEVESGNVSW